MINQNTFDPDSVGMDHIDGVEHYDQYIYATEILTFVCTDPKDVLYVGPSRKVLFVAQTRCFQPGSEWWTQNPFPATPQCFAVGNPANIHPGDKLMIDLDMRLSDDPTKEVSDIREVGRVDGRIITLTRPLTHEGRLMKPLPGGDVIKVLSKIAGKTTTYLDGWSVDKVEKAESKARWF